MMKNLHKGLMLSILIICSLLVSAQQTATSTDILGTALQDEAYQQQLGNEAFFNQSPLDIPYLEELEFRTETHEFDPNLQEYALRFKFNSRRQVKVQKGINQGERSLRYYAQQAYLEELLFHRYQLLIDVWYHQQQLETSNTQTPWYQDQEQLIRQRIAQNGQRSYDDLLKLEDDRLAFQQQYSESSQKLQLLTRLGNNWLDTPVDSIVFPALPTPADIALYWQEWQLDTLVLPWSVQAQKTQKELVSLELAAEQAEKRNRLNFLQVRYQGDNNPILKEQLTLGVGVTLPFRSARSVKNQYLLLEQREEAWQEAEKTRSWLEKLRSAEGQLASQLDSYDRAKTSLEGYIDQFAPQRLAELGVSEPELLLRAQGGIFYRQQLLLEEQQQLYQDYLEVLLLSGRLGQAPYRNWLSVEREGIGR
ncbi:hypothetical protein [Lewinella cohaerens]|uniref:hypothetical protein n=1 Tax=Lewinella cohaerens TaxID=70995 RepID=UPI000361D8C1|nr:hypothetical protein [Lewinella cohaerens]